jgi:hypothetical protein
MNSRVLHASKVKPPVPLPKLKLPKAHLRRAALGRTLLKSGRARGDLNLARAGQSLLGNSADSLKKTSSAPPSEPQPELLVTGDDGKTGYISDRFCLRTCGKRQFFLEGAPKI